MKCEVITICLTDPLELIDRTQVLLPVRMITKRPFSQNLCRISFLMISFVHIKSSDVKLTRYLMHCHLLPKYVMWLPAVDLKRRLLGFFPLFSISNCSRSLGSLHQLRIVLRKLIGDFKVRRVAWQDGRAWQFELPFLHTQVSATKCFNCYWKDIDWTLHWFQGNVLS